MHGLGYIVRSNARAVAGAGQYEAQVVAAAKVEIARLNKALAEANERADYWLQEYGKIRDQLEGHLT